MSQLFLFRITRSASAFLVLHTFSNEQHLPYPLYQSIQRRERSDPEWNPDSIALLEDPPPLTIIIPAYNEEHRLPRTIRSYVAYLARSDRWSNLSKVNFVVVNDGSTDDTVSSISRIIDSQFDSGIPPMKNTTGFSTSLLSLPYNQGKGAAIAAAIDQIDECNPNLLVLTTDADGSADPSCLEGLYDVMVAAIERTISRNSNPLKVTSEPVVVCGYRLYSDTAFGRLFFRWGFRTVVRLVCGDLGTRDSQCGFKLMTLSAAKTLYRNLHLTRWSHDVEVLYRAKLLNFTVTEAPVKWEDVDGSKLKAEGIMKVASRMFVDVCRCRLSYTLGQWSIDD